MLQSKLLSASLSPSLETTVAKEGREGEILINVFLCNFTSEYFDHEKK